MKISFGTRRLLLAVAVFAAMLAFLRSILPEPKAIHLTIAWGAASSASSFVLVVRRSDWRRVIPETIWALIAASVTFLIFAVQTHPPYRRGDEIPFVLLAAFLGWFLAGAHSRRYDIGDSEELT